MMRATRIKMRNGCYFSNSLLEIDKIYLSGSDNDRFYEKDELYDYLIENPGSIQTDIFPYPVLRPVLSANNEKYVRSSPDSSPNDNLLMLPRN